MAKRYPSAASSSAHLADAQPGKPWFEVLDPSLLERGWTWDYEDGALTLRAPPEKPRARQRRKRA